MVSNTPLAPSPPIPSQVQSENDDQIQYTDSNLKDIDLDLISHSLQNK